MAPTIHDTPLRFRWILAIRDQSELPSGARLLAYTLSTHMEANGGKCFPSLTTLATEARVDRRTVTRALRDLEAQGWLRRTRSRRKEGDWARTLYTPSIPEGVGAGNPYPPPESGEGRGRKPLGVGAQDPQGRDVGTPLDVHIDEQTDEQTTGGAASGGWPAQAAAIWESRFESKLAPGHVGKELKPLVDRHGQEEVLRAWANHVNHDTGRYAGLKSFVPKFAYWRDYVPGSGRRGPVEHDPTDTWDSPGVES